MVINHRSKTRIPIRSTFTMQSSKRTVKNPGDNLVLIGLVYRARLSRREDRLHLEGAYREVFGPEQCGAVRSTPCRWQRCLCTAVEIM